MQTAENTVEARLFSLALDGTLSAILLLEWLAKLVRYDSLSVLIYAFTMNDQDELIKDG